MGFLSPQPADPDPPQSLCEAHTLWVAPLPPVPFLSMVLSTPHTNLPLGPQESISRAEWEAHRAAVADLKALLAQACTPATPAPASAGPPAETERAHADAQAVPAQVWTPSVCRAAVPEMCNLDLG